MRNARTLNTFGRKNIAVFAALAISSLVATPFVMSASRALATSEDQPVAATLRIAPVEVAHAIRAAVDAGETTQLTHINVRPRIELADR